MRESNLKKGNEMGRYKKSRKGQRSVGKDEIEKIAREKGFEILQSRTPLNAAVIFRDPKTGNVWKCKSNVRLEIDLERPREKGLLDELL